eukprot:c11439_g1_i3.p1 GENE.c11439_g1_i3~~c11439_g1_i3.p1  ORF type:complete len:236 (-),score=44.70 c11439_g1_i3:141-848(-)
MLSEIRLGMNTIRFSIISSQIQVNDNIPQSVLQKGSINASSIAGAPEIEQFCEHLVVGAVDNTWTPNIDDDTIQEALPEIRDQHSSFCDRITAAAQGQFSVINVENDNQFNVKVDIIDPSQKTVHLVGRVYYLICHAGVNKEMGISDILRRTILFVEVISGDKTEEQSLLQLFVCMKAIAFHIHKHILFGLVIDKQFTRCRLVKYRGEVCCSDGIFPPSQLAKLAEIVKTHYMTL